MVSKNKDLVIDNRTFYKNPYTHSNLTSNPSKYEFQTESNFQTQKIDNFCPKCGTMLTLDDKYCPECGYKLN